MAHAAIVHPAGAPNAKIAPRSSALDTGGCVPYPEHCADGARSGDEPDVDCGGSCAPCPLCRACAGVADCAGTPCVCGICAALDDICDGRDEDCDGMVDEGCDGAVDEALGCGG